MDIPKAAWVEVPVLVPEDAPACAEDRMWEYLVPSRYFHMYLFADHKHHVSCWLPEGFLV
jgi:hypothetical protein